jgi:hypothetical protein
VTSTISAVSAISKAAERLRPLWQAAARKPWRGRALAAVLSAPMMVGAWFWLHPPVRLMNTSGQLLFVFVDGRMVARVPSVSTETPRAGIAIRVAFGARTFSAVTEQGGSVDQTLAQVEPGREHLYAPAHGDHCFFLQTTSYGSARAGEPTTISLDPGQTFWELPADIDAWFEGNPTPGPKNSGWSGGVRRAVRESECGSR